MKNKIAVLIADQEYVMLASEDEAYVRSCAEHVDLKLREVRNGSRLSLADSAVLAALNITDEYRKEQETSENLRRQIKEALEAAQKLERELSECKREIFRLQNKR